MQSRSVYIFFEVLMSETLEFGVFFCRIVGRYTNADEN